MTQVFLTQGNEIKECLRLSEQKHMFLRTQNCQNKNMFLKTQNCQNKNMFWKHFKKTNTIKSLTIGLESDSLLLYHHDHVLINTHNLLQQFLSLRWWTGKNQFFISK